MSPDRPTTTPPPATGRITRRAAVALAASALATITLTVPAWADGGSTVVAPTTATTSTLPLRTVGTSSTTTPPTGSGTLAPAAGTPIVPPPPTGWPPEPTRSATTSAPTGRLTGGSPSLGTPDCTTTFDEDEPIDLLPNDALDTFVVSPWWNQRCSGDWVRVYPSAGSNHYHLIYTDPDITNCLNADNDHGTPLGQLARGTQECEPIDPVTEPQSYINTMIGADVLTIDHLDGDEPGYPRRPFTLRRITIKNHAAKLCFKLGGPWEAAEPPAEGEVPGTFCWDQLDPATYDLTAYTEGSMYVTVTLADPDDDPNFGIDNLELNW